MNSLVFIIGCPRSGTTMLYHTLAAHPDFAYVSNHVNSHPEWTALAVVNRATGPSGAGFALQAFKDTKYIRAFDSFARRFPMRGSST